MGRCLLLGSATWAHDALLDAAALSDKVVIPNLRLPFTDVQLLLHPSTHASNRDNLDKAVDMFHSSNIHIPRPSTCFIASNPSHPLLFQKHFTAALNLHNFNLSTRIPHLLIGHIIYF